MRNKKIDRPGPGFVYVFRRDGLHKIGWSARPVERSINSILKGSEIVACYEMPMSTARIVERAVHRALDEFRVKNEWFSAPLLLIEAVIRTAAVQREKSA